ncbi:MAG: hypothetical protein HY260_20085 [Chloroflexi bacterium]|nr:hypothetical protein [Chloroflexota bacterium]
MTIQLTQDTQVIPALLAAPIQTGPIYSCFVCGGAADDLRHWLRCGSHLDEWAEHIGYLSLPKACVLARHPQRVARLGKAITPLEFDSNPATPFSERILANIAAIRAAVEYLAECIPPDERQHDPASRIIYRLLAGRLPPQAAIAEIRALVADH